METVQTFLQYYFNRPLMPTGKKMWFTINHLCLFGCLLFIGIFLYGEYEWKAPMFYMWAFFPLAILGYNVSTEYNTFKKNGISSSRMAWIFFGACGLDLIIIIAMLFFGSTN